MGKNGLALSTDQYNEIYGCRNGKGRSCIRDRNIPEEKKNCALGHIIGGLDPSVLLAAVQGPKTKEKEGSPEEEYQYRKEFVDYLYRNYGCKIPFETMAEDKGNGGDRVKLNKNSEYAYQNDGEGTNLGPSGDVGWFRVRFDDGYENSYKLKDLIVIKRKEEGDDKKSKTSKEQILQNMVTEKRKDFLDNIAAFLFEANQKDKKILERMFHNNTFKKGDKIIMNAAANEKYSHSREGSTGVVVNEDPHNPDIRFDKITDRSYSGQKHPVWDIEPKYMINLSASDKNNITLEDIKKKLSEIVKSLEEKAKEKTINKKDLTTQLLLKENFLLPGDGEGNYVLNYREMTKFIAPKLYAAYGNKDLYSEVDMCAPPSECHPNVLKFELSSGCNYNRCSYCDLYKGVKYCPRTFEQFKSHVDKVMKALGDYKEDIERLFIGGGNALAVEEDTLVKSLKYVNNLLDPRRISMYARTQDINKKGAESLQKINAAGLTNLYRGAETGSDEILQYIKKGTTLNDMLQASKTLAKTNINLSVTLMPGIGGKRFDEENVKGTVKFLNATDTQYITFMAISPSPNSEYDLIMKEEMLANKNRPMSNVEVVQQIKAILQGLEPKGQKIGMHGPEVHEIDYNPFYFKVTFDRNGKREAINLCDQYLRTHVI